MFNILICGVKTETIIGIVAIIIIVISLGLIIATAIRNYILHKKSLIYKPVEETISECNEEETNLQSAEEEFEGFEEDAQMIGVSKVQEIDLHDNNDNQTK